MPHEDGAIRTALPEWVVRKCNPLEARTFQTVLAREAEVSTVVEGVLMGREAVLRSWENRGWLGPSLVSETARFPGFRSW